MGGKVRTVTPVDQNKFFVRHEDKSLPPLSRGNCQQAAVASLLDLPLNAVPNFMDAEFFWGAYHQFLNERGMTDILVPNDREMPVGIHYLAYGPAPRGVRHAVIMCDGNLAHDPHPSRDGLLCVEEQHLIVPTVDVEMWRRWRLSAPRRQMQEAA